MTDLSVNRNKRNINKWSIKLYKCLIIDVSFKFTKTDTRI